MRVEGEVLEREIERENASSRSEGQLDFPCQPVPVCRKSI